MLGHRVKILAQGSQGVRGLSEYLLTFKSRSMCHSTDIPQSSHQGSPTTAWTSRSPERTLRIEPFVVLHRPSGTRCLKQ